VRLRTHRIDSALPLRVQPMDGGQSKAETTARTMIRGSVVRAGRLLEQTGKRDVDRRTDGALAAKHGGGESNDRVCKEHGTAAAERTHDKERRRSRRS
jgi:hypothetical protein